MSLIIYSLIAIVLQSVVLPRLTFLGAVPNLILVSIIVFSIVNEKQKPIYFAAALGFLQDILSEGIYLYTITYVIVATILINIKDNFVGNEFRFILGSVAIITPLALLFEITVLYLFCEELFSFFYIFKILLLTTIYNLILVPIVWNICHGWKK